MSDGDKVRRVCLLALGLHAVVVAHVLLSLVCVLRPKRYF